MKPPKRNIPDRECEMCKKQYTPTFYNQRVCIDCRPEFRKVQDRKRKRKRYQKDKEEKSEDRKKYEEWYSKHGKSAGVLIKRDGKRSLVPATTHYDNLFCPTPPAATRSCHKIKGIE